MATSAGNWNNTANWSTSSGGSGGASVPGSSDIAIFNGTNSANGDCTIDVAADVSGISITADYSGEISQGAQEVLVGTDDFTQAGGTYTCGAGELKVSAFRLDGGAFTAPSTTLEVGRGRGYDYELVRVDPAAATFNHNSGLVSLWVVYGNSSSESRIFDINTSNGAWTVHDLKYGGGDDNTEYNATTYRLGASDTIVVENDLTMSPRTDTAPTARLNVNRGTHRLEGNLTLGNEHTPADHSSAGLQYGSTIVEFMDAGDQTITSHPTHSRGPVVEINKDTGKVTTADGFDDVAIGGLILTKGTLEMPVGATLLFDLNSKTTQTIFTREPEGIFDASQVNVVFCTSYSHSSADTRYHDIELNGTMSVSNLTVMGGNTYSRCYHVFRLLTDDTFEVSGNLLMQNGVEGNPNMRLQIAGGAIEVQGNCIFGNPIEPGTGTYNNGLFLLGGSTTEISLVGPKDQTITHHHSGTNIISGASFIIDKTDGTVSLLSDMNLRRTDQDLIWTAGALDLGTNMLTVNRNVTIASGATTLGLTVADATTAGNIVAGGNASALDNVNLEVIVAANEPEVEGQTYTILTNSAVVNEFAEVTLFDYTSAWRGTVDYTANDGKNVTLSELIKIPAGTVITLQ